MSRRLWLTLLFTALAAVCLQATSVLTQTGDYNLPQCATCDYPGTSILALAHGHLAAFFALQPVMGPVTLLIRAPLVAIARGEFWQYRIGTLALLFIVAAIAVYVAGRLDLRGVSRLTQVALVAVLLLNPLISNAVGYGHPEEPFTAALCVLAATLSAEGRGLAGGVVLGLAVASKQWALLAVVPVGVAAVGAAKRCLVAAVLTAGVLTLPMLLGDPGRFLHIVGSYSGASGAYMTPSNVWWPFGHLHTVMLDGAPNPRYELPPALNGLSHPLVFVFCGALIAFWWRRSARPVGGPPRRSNAAPALELMALLFLIRCQLDTLTYGYHHLPMLFCLAVAEVLRGRRLPWVSLLVCAATWLMAHVLVGHVSLDGLFLAYMGWSIPLLGYLLVTALELPVAGVLGRRAAAAVAIAPGEVAVAGAHTHHPIP